MISRPIPGRKWKYEGEMKMTGIFVQEKEETRGLPAYETPTRRFGRGSRGRGEAAAVQLIPEAQIRPNPAQPRRFFDPDAIAALADSIRQYGIIQPLTVRQNRTDGGYELIAGERRLRAARSLGMEAVPCVLLAADEGESAAMAIIENLQRENLNMFEQAAAISSLIRLYSLTQDEIAARLSVSQSFVANKLRLLRYLPDERELILSASLTERHARALLRLSGDDRLTALRQIITAHLNVAETEALVEEMLYRDADSARDAAVPPTRTTAKPEIPRNRPAILRDVRLFCNSLNHAVDIMRQAGISATTEKRETPAGVEIRVFIPNVSRET